MDGSLDAKRVKDVMVPLDEYAIVTEDATFREAIQVLEQSRQGLAPGRPPHRAVLVRNRQEKIVGKVGQLAFLKALEPRGRLKDDLGRLDRAGVDSEFVGIMMNSLEFWQDNLSVLCRRASSLKVKDFMSPVTERINGDAMLTEAIHKIVTCQTLSILVTEQGEVIGILRLSDLIAEIATFMSAMTD
ncbi:MAG: CBS domain-containing protein [Phycisphaerales bacterium]|nr:MAG: CBS domain-containing protein [Phycisphaerales bacterium]